MVENPLNENILFSGGAKGADTLWGILAESVGHSVIHWSFQGHKSDCNNIAILSREQLLVADKALYKANKRLHRSFPTKNDFVNNLLRRNYYQILETSGVYAVANLVPDNSQLNISGGTAWALQLYIDRCEKKGMTPNLNVYAQNQERWIKWSGDSWIDIDSPERPRGIYTGIGSRTLTDRAIKSIQLIYSS